MKIIQSKLIISLLLSLTIAVSSCSSGKKTTSPVSAKATSPISKNNKGLSEHERKELDFTFVNAAKEKMLGNMDRAAELYAQCIRIDGSNDASMFELARILVSQNKVADAQFFAKSAAAIDPENEWYQLLLADIYQKTRQYDDAAIVYSRLTKKFPHRTDYFLEHANVLVLAGKHNEALKIYDNIENQMGVSPELALQKQQLWIKLGKIDKAAEELLKLIEKYPDEPQFYGMLAELYQANDMHEKAIELYNKIEQLDPGNPFVNLSLAEHYRTKGEKAKSFTHLKLAFNSPKLELETKINILSSYFPLVQNSPEMMEQALELNEEMVKTHGEDARVYAIYGDFLFTAKKHAEAKVQYLKALELDKDKFAVWQQLLWIDNELKDYNSMKSRSEEALTYFPNQPLVYFFNGLANGQLKNHEEAVDAYKTGSMLVVDNDAMLTQFYSSMGDSYHQLKKHKESDEAYDKALNIDPQNASVLNNYSYYLSLRGENLEKAEQMSKLSNKLEPGNASYEDTHAWVLYKAGNYKEAKEWLEKAMNNGGGENGTILEHYGDVLYKLGQKDEAIKYWNKAKTAGDGSDLLNKKVADRALYE
ncbi:MAG: tetratricopeptide repeat protein [Bacteroidia bacterium]